MKPILITLVALVAILIGFTFWTDKKETPTVKKEKPLTLILNSENIEGKLPRHFRISHDPWSREKEGKEPSRVGLDTLNASGSGQFSTQGLRAILSHLNTAKPIVVVDLRQESHGFANGIAISWYADRDTANVGKTLEEIEEDESNRLQNLLGKQINIEHIISKPQDVITQATNIPIEVQEVSTEKELTEHFELGYFRIPVTDHLAPSPENVERFLEFVRNLPPDTWLHFHCEAGDGRTTSFMCMYDILHNAKNVSFEDILERQYLLGGMNLAQMPDQSSWKYKYAVDRKNFLQNFYEKMKSLQVNEPE